MKKLFWIDLRKYEKKFLTAAVEAGAEAILLPDGKSAEVKKVAKVTTIAADGDLKPGKDVAIVRITKKADEEEVTKLKGTIPAIIENIDWTIIPLENLISKTTNLIQNVASPKEAKLALETMERGADGVILTPHSVNDIIETGRLVREMGAEHFKLEKVKIIDVKPVAMSDRCMVDSTSLLPPGVGMLVGDTGKAMFLVHNENVESPYCAPRPFRVNAGAVHAYIRLPNNKTKYLCELSAGDEVIAVDPAGNSCVVAIGRNKIERRPMLLVSAESKDKKRVSLVMQNAETIRLTSPEGNPISVTTIKPGDEVLAFFTEATGRHFGEAVKETITEK